MPQIVLYLPWLTLVHDWQYESKQSAAVPGSGQFMTSYIGSTKNSESSVFPPATKSFP